MSIPTHATRLEGTLDRFYQSELNEVLQYLNSDRREKYTRFQAKIVKDIESLRDNSDLRPSIYNVISRDSGSGQSLKADKKIALKLNKWRRQPREGQRPARVADIHDIIGVTVICPYPSDIDKLVDYLRGENSIASFKIKDGDDSVRMLSPEQNKGYRACHVVLEGRGHFSNITCELQIKTVVVQGWGVKTHDLIYKPPGEIDARLKAHMEKLSHTLQILDDQSEILKQLIEEAWVIDKRRRQVAQMMMMMVPNAFNAPGLSAVVEFWTNEQTRLAIADLSDPTVMKFQDMVAEARKEHGLSKELCRVASIFAIGRIHGDRDDFALDLADEWISEIADHAILRDAIAFKSCVAMSLGEYEESIRCGRKVLDEAIAQGTEESILSAKLNLAYFLAEAYYHRAFDEPTGAGVVDRTSTDACADEAMTIVTDLVGGIDEDAIRVELLDTIGAVMIACSGEEGVIRNGLEKCNRALKAAEGSGIEKSVKSFFDLHERRAFRKILSLG